MESKFASKLAECASALGAPIPVVLNTQSTDELFIQTLEGRRCMYMHVVANANVKEALLPTLLLNRMTL